MNNACTTTRNRSAWLERSLSRWENEGGGTATDSVTTSSSSAPDLTNTELVHLRMRIIALENLVIALLTTASDEQRDLVREVAKYISPRPGFTHHPMTEDTAAQMMSFVQRAERLQS